MKTLQQLQFNLRHQFEELNQLFAIFNNMIVNGSTCKVLLKTDSSENQYLHINIYRCKKAFASIEITRLLQQRGKISQELLDNVKKINSMKNVYLHFSLDESFSVITMSVYDEKYEQTSIPEIVTSSHKDSEELMSIAFSLRKDFNELPDLLSVVNHMLSNNYNIYISTDHSKKDPTCSYISFKIMYKNVWGASLCINVGYPSTLDVRKEYGIEFSKLNYICQTNPKICPIWFSILQSERKRHGPLLRIHLGKPDDEVTSKKIEEQLELIFPQ